MKTPSALALLSAALIGQVAAATDAPPVTDNPVGVTYKATLPDQPFFKGAAINGNVKGYVSAVAGENGKGVKFSVKFDNLPSEGGPFIYHIHVDPTSDGNCTKTLAHLDPFARGEDPPCDKSSPQTCQVGDLSGKYGPASGNSFSADYTDLYASTKEGIGAFFGNRSIVVHYANKTRLTCANFVKVGSSGSGGSNSSQPNPTSARPSPSATSTFVAGAALNMVSVPLALAGIAAVAFAI